MIAEIPKSPVLDAAIIGAAQKVEHYEISGYGTARTMAEMLGQQDAAELLEETLDEEKATDENADGNRREHHVGRGQRGGGEEEEEEIEEEA